MLFYFKALNLTKFLNEDAPSVKEGENNRASLILLDAGKHLDFVCKNHILNGLDNMLYNVYSIMKFAKELGNPWRRKTRYKEIHH